MARYADFMLNELIGMSCLDDMQASEVLRKIEEIGGEDRPKAQAGGDVGPSES
jgi:hypothetical protein